MPDNNDSPPFQVIQGGAAGDPVSRSNIEELTAQQEAQAEGGKAAATILIGYGANLRRFRTADHVAHVCVPLHGQEQVWAVRSSEFKKWLRHQYYENTGKAPPAQALEDAIGVLEARAEINGPEESLHLRVGGTNGELYVDLATKTGPRFVKVTAEGWAITPDTHLRFARPRSLLPMPAPARGGSVELLRPFVNVKSDTMFMLLVVWLVAALMGNMPVPVLVIQGIQGSAKSTLLRIIRVLVDPAKGVLRGQPRHEHDLAIAASRSWLLTYDNLSFIPDWLSDAFCRVVTGGAFAARELYKDADEIIFEYRRPAVLNGIEELVTRSDLLDRGVVLNLQKIEDTERRDEEEFWREFELAQPHILGALLDTVAGVLRELPNVVLPRKPRMADFARVGVAVETALGWPAGSFMAAYTGNRAIANEIAIEASLFGPFIRILAARPGGWHGSPEALLRQLDQMYDRSKSGMAPLGPPSSYGGDSSSAGRTIKPKKWPANAQQLSAKLQRIIPNLAEIGVEVDRGKTAGGNSARTIQIGLKNTPPAGPAGSTPPPSSPPPTPAPAPSAPVQQAPFLGIPVSGAVPSGVNQ